VNFREVVGIYGYTVWTRKELIKFLNLPGTYSGYQSVVSAAALRLLGPVSISAAVLVQRSELTYFSYTHAPAACR